MVKSVGRRAVPRSAAAVGTILTIAACGAGAQGSGVVALEGAVLIDGNGGVPVPQAVVLVENGLIRAAGPAGDIQVPPGAERIDLRGRFLMPGLIDMHAHAMVPRCTGPGQPLQFDRQVSERMLGVLLDFGITTARSPATPTTEGVAIRDAVASGQVAGPRLFVSAELINGARKTPEDVRAAVRAELASPVDFIKLYSGLSPEAVRAGIEEAHAAGVRVIGHLGRTSWTDGARMGIDFLTHATGWSVEDLPAENAERYRQALGARGPMRARIDWLELFDPQTPAVTAMIDELVRRRISVDPTLVAFDSKFTAPSNDRYRANPGRAVVPEMLADWERCGTPTDDWTADDYARMARAWPRLLRLVNRYHSAGVLLTAGSDVTNPWVIPGESLHQELELLVAAGIPPAEVLRIATRNGAEALGVLGEVGTVEAGKRADLLVLERDPIAAIGNTRSIVSVMQGGRWIRR